MESEAIARTSADVPREESADEALAAAARADPDAFEALYVRFRVPVYRFVRRRADNDEDAADLTALTFERALRSIGRYRPSGGGILAWLLRIARNAAIDAARDRRRRAPLPRGGSADLIEPSASDDRLLRVETRASLLRLVEALPDLQRDAVLLRYGSGLTAREIGAVIGKSEAATQKLLSRAIATLKENYDDDI